jgi:hypothetical protein
MAFYADVYGYIARKEKGEIPCEVLEHVYKSAPIFRACFSAPVTCKSAHYISFACSVKLDEGEEELWLSPFEMMLKRINFLSAAVNVVHEESNYIMMYSYVKDVSIQKFISKMTEQFLDETVLI